VLCTPTCTAWCLLTKCAASIAITPIAITPIAITITDVHKLPEMAPSLRHAARLQRLLLAADTGAGAGAGLEAQARARLRLALDGAFLVKFMSSVAASKFEVGPCYRLHLQ
jgi:hypothetical protein